MATFLYHPEIRVRVAPHKNANGTDVLDITNDMVSGQMNLRTNGVHTFTFQLQNAQRKYDGVLQPMDRIVVEMKRIRWVRVFSGYLNNGPIFSAWPRVLNMQASCTLKRLQYWYWDSTSVDSVNLIMGSMGESKTASNASPQTPPSQGTPATPVSQDLAIRDTVVKILTTVVQWPQEKIHIAEVPAAWYAFADTIATSVIQDSSVQDLIGDWNSTTGATFGATIGGQSITSNGTLSPGSYGGTNLTQAQVNNAALIYNIAKSRGLSNQAAIIAVATAMQESSLTNLAGGTSDSAGLFQQRPSQGWGTLAQVTDPTYATNKFLDALVKVPGWDTMPVTQAAQAVQRSAYPNAYATWVPMATAAVQALSSSPGAAPATPAAPAPAPAPGAPAAPASSGAPPQGSGRAVASVGFSVIKRNPAGHILYRLGGDDPYTSPDPRYLDCSSFVDWVYYNSVGSPIVPGGRSTAATLASKVKTVDVSTAIATKGALLFLGSAGSEYHVEVSLGNGYTAAAHTDSVPPDQQVTVSQDAVGGGWSKAGLLPGVNYTDAATTPQAAAVVAQATGAPTTVSDPNEFGPNALPGAIGGGGALGDNGAAAAAAVGAQVFNAVVNLYTWGLQPDPSGALLAGPRAMMNDEPLLPYISNLMSACMRSWCSGPNGDFISWFPDYFGLWDSAAKMNIQSIELMDFTVEWNDQQIVTHQYVIGTPAAMFDTRTATVTGVSLGNNTSLALMLTTNGIATMDFPQIFKAVFGQDASQQFVDQFLDRFGARPNVVNLPSVQQGKNEFFMALYLFMQRWAGQFKASVPMTFMPELWPGMLLCLPEFDFQAYILEVQHNFQFGPNGGFNTAANICAPARTTDKTSIFGLLPLAGSGR